MAEYTEQDAERASKIVEGLLEGERRFDGFEEGFSVVDVEAHAEEFRRDLYALGSIRFDFPAMEVAGGPAIPVSLRWFLNLSAPGWPDYGRVGRRITEDLYAEAIYYVLRERYRDRPLFDDIPALSLDGARANFSQRARVFLATRLSALRRPRRRGRRPPNVLNIRQYAGGPRTQVAGCLFSVSTNSPGLRAFWSGANFISPTFLGGPTSPAVRSASSGNLRFRNRRRRLRQQCSVGH